jgi:hypothetical protein
MALLVEVAEAGSFRRRTTPVAFSCHHDGQAEGD